MILLWCPRSKAVHVAVVHAERGRDQNRVVNLEVGSTEGACAIDVFVPPELAALLHPRRNREKGFEFFRDSCFLGITLNEIHKDLVAIEIRGRGISVDSLAIVAVVKRGDICGNQFALAR